MNKYFLRWLLLMCIAGVGAYFLYVYEIFNLIYKGDITKISFLIIALFSYFSIRSGIKTFRPKKIYFRDIDVLEFFSGKFFLMGMIGTVLGFIYMLQTCFVNLDASNVVMMQMALSKMSIGMGTALFTTATGMICGLLLKLQIFNLQQAIERNCE